MSPPFDALRTVAVATLRREGDMLRAGALAYSGGRDNLVVERIADGDEGEPYTLAARIVERHSACKFVSDLR